MIEETVQVRDRGVITLPSSVRAKNDIKAGDSYRLVDLDGILILSPMVALVPELAREIERLRREAGVTMDELFRGLREERARYTVESTSGSDAAA